MTTSRNDDDDTVVEDLVDHTTQAVQAMLAAVAIADKDGQDFAEWLSHCLATVAAISGGMQALVAGRPGSWESSKVLDFVQATVGDDARLADYLPEGFRPPLGSVALHESDDHTLWLVTRPWAGTDDYPATVYVRQSALRPEEDVYDDGKAWLVDQADPAGDFRWRELGAGDVAEALAHAGAQMHDGQAAPGVRLGALYRDGAGVYFEEEDREYVARRPLAVQRYLQLDHALTLEDAETDAIQDELSELAVLAGELTAEERTPDLVVVTADEREQIAMLYATALALARTDDVAFERARQIKRDYDEWFARWRRWYTDAQPAGTPPLGI